MINQKPLVLLDIDGVVNAFDGWIAVDDITRPRGYRWEPREGYRVGRARNYDLLLHPDHPAWIAEIEAEAEIRWSTMWMRTAATDFAPVAGFGHDWDHIDFDSEHQKANPGLGILDRRMGNGVGNYKHAGIDAHSQDRHAVVVIDDDLQVTNYLWAERRNEAGLPTLLVQPDPREGLTREQVDTILAFVREHAVSEEAA